MRKLLHRESFSLGLFAFLILLSACSSGGSQAAAYTRVSAATLHAGDAIPLPQGTAQFFISGKVGALNADDHIEMDLASMEAASLVDYTVMDPFLNTEITYRGPLLSDLLDLWQVSADATTLHLTALNDYSIDMPIALARDFPVVFAIQADGEYMPIAERGPAMLVLPYNEFEFDRPASDAYWIWQLESIEVR